MDTFKFYSGLFIVFAISGILISCEKEQDESMDYSNIYNLPKDEGGGHMPQTLGSTDAPYGYYVYTPSYYNEIENIEFPVLIFLHGSGEKGNSETKPELLDKVLVNGPPKMINSNEWNPEVPMLVFSPQCHDSFWDDDKLKEFVEYLISNYKVNVRRIYLTGLSMGGYATFNYVGEYGYDSYIAAAVPICGGGKTGQAKNFKGIPIWAFHGDADDMVFVDNSIQMVDAINKEKPKLKAKLTVYPGVGHNSWERTYTGNGMGEESGEYDPFNQSIYDWMLGYERTDLDAF